jgi:chromosome segregation ATPase
MGYCMDKFDIDWVSIGGYVLSLIVAVGAIIEKILAHRRAQREISVEEHKAKTDDDRLDLEKERDDYSAAVQMADILKTIIEPLALRVGQLENDSLKKQNQINELNDKVIELKRTISEKDTEIIRLTNDYKSQVKISNEQEHKIKCQEVRIKELEDELKKLKNERG